MSIDISPGGSSVEAYFYETFGLRDDSHGVILGNCHQSIVANCALAVCDDFVDGGSSVAPISSGIISISPALGAFGNTIGPAPMSGWYTALDQSGATWFSSGQTVSFTAAGAAVGPWSGSVSFPELTPSVTRDGSAGTLAYRWSPTSGDVDLAVGSGLRSLARCRYRGEDGLGVIPDQVIAMLGGVSQINNRSVVRSTYASVSVGRYEVMLLMSTSQFAM